VSDEAAGAMALQEAILKSLQSATTANDAQRLRDAHAAIVANLNGQTGQRAGLESLVVCAETSLKVGVNGSHMSSQREPLWAGLWERRAVGADGQTLAIQKSKGLALSGTRTGACNARHMGSAWWPRPGGLAWAVAVAWAQLW
jgi:hypothetical protein